MFIATQDLFKIGIGPSSSHTMGPLIAALNFRQLCEKETAVSATQGAVDQPFIYRLQVILKGSLAHTGKGHSTDKAILIGLHGYKISALMNHDLSALFADLETKKVLAFPNIEVHFKLEEHLVFDKGPPLPQHPNGLRFRLLKNEEVILEECYFSIGGGFVLTEAQIESDDLQVLMPKHPFPFPFDTAADMLAMAASSGLSIAQMKIDNELMNIEVGSLDAKRVELKNTIARICCAMFDSVDRGIVAEGILPGGMNVERRAKALHDKLRAASVERLNIDWLSVYAIAVNEENAAGHMVVTAPTNGAAGVIPAVLYYYVKHQGAAPAAIETFLLTAAAIGGLIKHNSSISGAEVGCQGEVGSAAAMAASGLCAAKGGTPEQVENAAEIALEHHLGMTCDPVRGLVQVPCIERNAFGAVKAYSAASLALMGSGKHIMSLDACVEAMRQTGVEMSRNLKETSLGGLAQTWIEC